MRPAFRLLLTLVLVSCFPGCASPRAAAGGALVFVGGALTVGGVVALDQQQAAGSDDPRAQETAVLAVGAGLFSLLLGAIVLPPNKPTDKAPPAVEPCRGCASAEAAPVAMPFFLPVTEPAPSAPAPSASAPAASASPSASPSAGAPAPVGSGAGGGVVPWFP